MRIKNSKTYVARLIIICLALSALFSGCSLKTSHPGRTIEISLPQLDSQLGSINRVSRVPAGITDFTCYLINVNGKGIDHDPRLSCSQSTDGLGIFTGFLPTGSQSVILNVPEGTGREIQLIGIQNPQGSCPDLVTTLNASSFYGIGNLYLLASTTVDILTDISVTMTPSFNSTQPQTTLKSCTGPSLTFSTQPYAYQTSGTTLLTQPVVQIDSPSSNTAAASITLAAYSDASCSTPASGTLTATTNPLTASAGSATFSGVSYSGTAGTIYLGASASGINSACSSAINILNPATLLVSGVTPTSVTVDSSNVYWGTSTDWSTSTSSISKVPTTGGSATVLASGIPYTSSIAVDASNAYWIDNGNSYKVPIGGGSVTTLAPAYNTNIVVSSGSLYYAFSPNGVQKVSTSSGSVTVLSADSAGGAAPYAVAVDSTYVYWSNWSGDLKKIPLGGGSETTISTGVMASSLAVDSTNVYWSDYQGIHKIPIGGGTQTILTSSISPVSIVLDATRIYWASSTSVGYVPITGGSLTVLATSPSPTYVQNGNVTSNCIAVDSTSVYWGSTNGLYKISK
jgi:hypothetical protein